MDTYLDILPEGTTAIAVKTKGHNFDINFEGISSTGCWVVTKERIDDYVIVFHETPNGNDVYLGEFLGKNKEEFTERQGKKYPRYRIFMRELRLVLTTNQTWTSYVDRPSGGFERIYLKNTGEFQPVILDPNSSEAEEGYMKDSVRMSGTRDRTLASNRKKKDNYTCQACFNKYLVNGKYVIDCHHLKPIALGKRKTKIEDLVSLCPTCHRISHTRVPPYDLDELRKLAKHQTQKEKINES